jgi:hypothetical protein
VLPVVAVSFIYSASFSTLWVYVGVYAFKGLGWRPSQVDSSAFTRQLRPSARRSLRPIPSSGARQHALRAVGLIT